LKRVCSDRRPGLGNVENTRNRNSADAYFNFRLDFRRYETHTRTTTARHTVSPDRDSSAPSHFRHSRYCYRRRRRRPFRSVRNKSLLIRFVPITRGNVKTRYATYQARILISTSRTRPRPTSPKFKRVVLLPVRTYAVDEGGNANSASADIPVRVCPRTFVYTAGGSDRHTGGPGGQVFRTP